MSDNGSELFVKAVYENTKRPKRYCDKCKKELSEGIVECCGIVYGEDLM